MNYKKHYAFLIKKAQSRVKSQGYFEEHHIVPESLGGSNNRNNLVNLTAKEHLIAHLLLAKIHGGGMWNALVMMNNTRVNGPKLNSRTYSKARQQFALEQSKRSSGENNYFYGKKFFGELNPMWGKNRPDLSEYNRTRISPLLGKSGALSKTSKPLCVEFENGDVVFTEVGVAEFSKQFNIPYGSMCYIVSTGKSLQKYNIVQAWRP